MTALYDTIGKGYAALRRPDPSIQRAILEALGNASTVVNVGAGAGSYEPADRWIVAVEPSMTMIRQRPSDSAAVVQATAMALPFRSGSFEAALAILTVHHWPDKGRGLEELRRVAKGRVVIFTWDPAHPGFWLTEYFPEALTIDRPMFPTLDEFQLRLGSVEVRSVPIPHDCSDGFMAAYWRRPEAYLDQRVRDAISTFSRLPDVTSGLRRLNGDLRSGEWQRRFGELSKATEFDLGYRLIISAGARAAPGETT